ncbi:MAG TPA: patatin-like phospholipase family protein [Thermodesulfobacteriota bacterium]
MNMKGSAPITLILLGSGVRFPAFIGALSAIEERGIRVKTVIGASAGSIVGTLYASGHSPAALRRMAMDTDLSRLRDVSLSSIVRLRGVYSGRALEEHVDGLLEGRRFGDEFRMTPLVVATDILNNRPFVFSRSNFPEMKVSEAIRYSIGIPLVFPYKHFNSGGREHVFVDGNIMSGAVEDMFASEGGCLVLRVASRRASDPIPGRFTALKYMKKLLLIMMQAVESERVKGRVWKDTILISCGDITPVKFSITSDEKKYLIEQGYLQTRRYLDYKWGA